MQFRYVAGAVVAVAALASSLLALRAAPVGFDERGEETLQLFAEQIDGETVAFLGVDRFAGYYLRGTLARAPAGYVPEEVEPREDKPWLQGYAVDFDNLEAGKLDQFEWAITTAAAFNSDPPGNFEEVAADGDYVLWRRTGATAKSRIVAAPDPAEVSEPWTTAYEANGPGGTLDCDSAKGGRFQERGGTALVRPLPVVVPPNTWIGDQVEPAAGGQQRGFSAESEIGADLPLVRAGQEYELSLQYHSQVPFTLTYDGEVVAELPASLEGMYFNGAGRGPFWSAGEIVGDPDAVVQVIPEAPEGLRETLGVENRVWLGELAATPVGEAREAPLADACGEYVDHFTLDRGGRD